MQDFSQYAVYCTSYSKANKCLEQSLQDSKRLRAFIDVRNVNPGGGVLLQTPAGGLELLVIHRGSG